MCICMCVRYVVSHEIQVIMHKEHGEQQNRAAEQQSYYVTRGFSQRNLDLPLRCYCTEQKRLHVFFYCIMTENNFSKRTQCGKHKWKQVWKKSESIWLASGIQKIGIRNPDDWNPEFKRLESGLQRIGIWNAIPLWILLHGAICRCLRLCVKRVSMGSWLLRLTVKILVFLRLTVNFFPLRLKEMLKINFHCFKKLIINFHCSKTH